MRFCDEAYPVKAAARPPHSKKGTREGNLAAYGALEKIR